MYLKDRELLTNQYNKFPYPKPIENLDDYLKKKIPLADPNTNWHILWPEKKYNNFNLNILVAGCGTSQAAILARLNPQNKFVGIDISKESINWQNKLKEKYEISNLELICNDFRSVKFNYKFDYIISSGVIHHLEKPESALKYFCNNLKDDGVINLMVYGDKDRYSINQINKIFKTLKLKQNIEDIETAKIILSNLDSKHPAKIFLQKISDIKSKEGAIDLLLHSQEHHYDILDLNQILDKNNLIIKNFFNGKTFAISKFLNNNKKILKKINQLKYSEKLSIGQILNWNDMKIELVLTKKKNLNESIVIKKPNLLECYFYYNKSIHYNINKDRIIINEKNSDNKYPININKNFILNWEKILNGKINLKSILKDNDKKNHKNIYELFQFLHENQFINISFFEIDNYINYIPSNIKKLIFK